METNPRPHSANLLNQSGDLSLVAGLAAIALDSALKNRETELTAVANLAAMLGPEGQTEETVKKAMARVAHRHKREVTSNAANDHAPSKKDVSFVALQQLTRMVSVGLSEFRDADIADLRDFCLQLSLSARMPRGGTLLKLR